MPAPLVQFKIKLHQKSSEMALLMRRFDAATTKRPDEEQTEHRLLITTLMDALKIVVAHKHLLPEATWSRFASILEPDDPQNEIIAPTSATAALAAIEADLDAMLIASGHLRDGRLRVDD